MPETLLTSMDSARVYLDHNATTPLSPLLKKRWPELFELWGNPSSIHTDSRVPRQWLRETRQKLAKILQCSQLEILFNSGASEGNSTVLKSVWELRGKDRPEIIISSVEHPSLVKTAEYLKSHGAIIHVIPVRRNGDIDLEFLKSKLSEKTALVSVMFANNETGTIFPIQKISELAHSVGALMHSDCVQTLGKAVVNFAELGLDYATFSAHKFYALKGCGFVFVRKSSPWVPLIFGGGQERSRRGGTENVLGIAALGIALERFSEVASQVSRIEKLRNQMETEILQKMSDVQVTAGESLRVSNTSNLIIKGVDGETLLMSLDLKGFSVSTGAACSSGNPEPSPVLLAMGLTRDEAQNSLRISLGWETTGEDVQRFVQVLVEVVAKLREINNEDMNGVG